MNPPSPTTDTAEAWRQWALLTYRDPAPLIERRRAAAQRDERYTMLKRRWTERV